MTPVADNLAPDAAIGTTTFAWQGWLLRVDAESSPMALQGDYAKGKALLGDLRGPTISIQWSTPRGRIDPAGWADRALLADVGTLAAEHAVPLIPSDDFDAGLIFEEFEPPGRNVFVGHSRLSGRCVMLVEHVKQHSTRLRKNLVPGLIDQTGDKQWRIFDLSCRVPDGFALAEHKLNAGDLALTFRGGRNILGIRQIGPASLALKRQSLEQWLAAHVQAFRKHYSVGQPSRLPSDRGSESSTDATISTTLHRKLRFTFSRHPKRRTVFAWHEETRDRVMIVEAETLADATPAGRRACLMFAAKPKHMPREQVMAARPALLVDSTLQVDAAGNGKLSAPLPAPRYLPWLKNAAKGRTKTYEFDEVGVFVLQKIDGRRTVEQLIRALAERYKLDLRQAEASTLAFLKMLMQRGIVGVPLAEEKK